MRGMKSMVAALLVVSTAATWRATAAGEVAPASVTITNLRDQVESYISPTFFFEGSTLLFTNCVVYSGSTTNSPVQSLAGGTVLFLTIGTVSSCTTNQATFISEPGGTWWCSVTVPANLSPVYVQTKLVAMDATTYIYPWKMLRTKKAM